MINHVFRKDDSPELKEVVARIFDNISPAKTLTPDRYENPIITLKRILGDNFHDLLTDDILEIAIQDLGSFNIELIKNDFDQANVLVQYISFIFEGFLKMNGAKPLTHDSITVPVKFAVTSETNGTEVLTLTLGELSPVAMFDDNNIPIGIYRYEEIVGLGNQIGEGQAALKKLGRDNSEQVMAISRKVNESFDKLAKIYHELSTNFFKIISDKSGLKIEDIYDVTTIFSFEVEETPEKIHRHTTVLQYHDLRNSNLYGIKAKFGLDQLKE